jgi:hypothetical protein
MLQSTLLPFASGAPAAAGLFAPLIPAASAESVFMPENAPFVALAFLATGGGLLVGGGAIALCLALGRRRLARRIGAALGIGAAAYAILLVGFSWTSRERVLEPGAKKYFCEIDCHLAYSLVAADTAKTLGVPPRTVTAGSRFVIARVRTWFDPRTIASFRGNGPLSPNPRVAFLVDGAGRTYGISAAGTRAYEEARGSTVPFSRVLTPGDSYETALVFDPPEGVTRLFVGDPEGVERFLIGHENSFFHRKIFFGLPPRKSAGR